MADDKERLATLIRHWIDHNDGHRLSYLEWRDRLADLDLPVTRAALERVAELTAEVSAELQKAADELGTAGSNPHHHHRHTGH